MSCLVLNMTIACRQNLPLSLLLLPFFYNNLIKIDCLPTFMETCVCFSSPRLTLNVLILFFSQTGYFRPGKYLLQSKCRPVSALLPAEKAIVKISRGVVAKPAWIHWRRAKFITSVQAFDQKVYVGIWDAVVYLNWLSMSEEEEKFWWVWKGNPAKRIKIAADIFCVSNSYMKHSCWESKGNHDGLRAMTPNICVRDKTPTLPWGQTTSASHQLSQQTDTAERRRRRGGAHLTLCFHLIFFFLFFPET